MLSTLSIRSFALPSLWLALTACCHPKPPAPIPAPVVVSSPCLTERPPATPDLTACSDRGNSPLDCLAAYTLQLEAWGAGAWAKCGERP